MVELHISTDTPEQMASMIGLLNPATMVMMEMETSAAAKPAPSSKSTTPAPVSEEPVEEKVDQTEASSVENDPTIDDIRTALAMVSKTHDLMKAKEVLKAFGVARVSDLPKEKYNAFLAAANEVAQ
jgi:hypothetical protein